VSRPALLVVVLLVAGACTTGDTVSTSAPTLPAGVASTRVVPSATTEGSPSPEPSGVQPVESACWSAPAADGGAPGTWTDVTADVGLIAPLTGMHAHAAAWGDVDADGALDLLVGTFADRRAEVYAVRGASGPSPDRLLTGNGSVFTIDESFAPTFGRASGAAFADLDADGDSDLVVSRNGDLAASSVYENTGSSLVEVETAGLPQKFGGRSVGVLHLDGDGQLDLVLVEDRYVGGNSRALRNRGGLRFEDAGDAFGWPAGVHGLGISTGDLNGDGLTDVFVSGSNRLFVGTGVGVREVDANVTAWAPVGREDDVAGSAMGDVDRDGKLDLLVGHHFNSTLDRGEAQSVRLFLNRTPDGADPVFEEVTASAGLVPIPTKAPHVELADVDNDGWLDIITSASAEHGKVPATFMNEGATDGITRFTSPDGLGSAQYWVTAPTADFNRDGRLDVLAVEWEPSLPSILFRNASASGNWLEVAFDLDDGGGPGTRISLYEVGRSGDPDGLLGSSELVASQGYAAGAVEAAHFGLGEIDLVDVVVRPPLGAAPMAITGVAVNQRLQLPDGCD